MKALVSQLQHSPLAGNTDETHAPEKVIQEAVLWKADQAGSRRDA